MITIKVSDEQAKRLGISSADDFDKRISALLDSEAANASTATTNATELSALTSRISAVEASIKGLPDFGAIKTEAIKASVDAAKAESKVEASRAALEIYSKAGNPPAGDKEGGDVTRSKDTAIDAGDFGAQYDASAELKSEFTSKAAYVAFAKANADGRVKISARK